jgi:hypothetical protein
MIAIEELKRERPLSLTEAAALIGDYVGRRPSTSTCCRWALKGVRGGVKLETTRVGGTVFTTESAIREFIERLSLAPQVAQGLQEVKGGQAQHASAAALKAEATRHRHVTAKAHLDRVLGPRPARRAK